MATLRVSTEEGGGGGDGGGGAAAPSAQNGCTHSSEEPVELVCVRATSKNID